MALDAFQALGSSLSCVFHYHTPCSSRAGWVVASQPVFPAQCFHHYTEPSLFWMIKHCSNSYCYCCFFVSSALINTCRQVVFAEVAFSTGRAPGSHVHLLNAVCHPQFDCCSPVLYDYLSTWGTVLFLDCSVHRFIHVKWHLVEPWGKMLTPWKESANAQCIPGSNPLLFAILQLLMSFPVFWGELRQNVLVYNCLFLRAHPI